MLNVFIGAKVISTFIILIMIEKVQNLKFF